uniref:Cobalt transport protein n=1 Tax=Ignisphaera aggregans TaxID=334771 RepID=A0A7C5XMG5_9CREN
MLRNLAYIFAYKVNSNISLVTRLYIPLILMIFLIFAINIDYILMAAIQVIAVFILEFIIFMYIGGFKRIASAVILISIFIAMGLAIRFISIMLGYEPTKLEEMAISTSRVIEFFFAITIAMQWIRVSEYRWLFKKLRLEDIAILFTVTLTQLSSILVAYSEALTTIRLKYGGRGLQKIVKPLVIYSISYGRDVAEAIYMYGVPEPKVDISIGKIDILLIVAISSTLIFLGIAPKL